MYLIDIVNEDIEEGDWGDFTVHKEFNVSYNPHMSNKKSLAKKIAKNKTRRNINYCRKHTRKNTTNGINGYILQEVKKNTNAYVLCKNGLKKINDIEKFTDGNVKYMNDSYYELFPVLDGKACYGDNFQNGEILHYTIDENGESGGDNNPPTRGTIKQIGIICFIEAPYESEISTQNKMRRNIRTIKDTYINIFGIDWNINTRLPANGLPFSTSDKVIDLFFKSKSNTINHIVNVKWNGIFVNENNKNNENNENNKNGIENINVNNCKFNNINTYNKSSNDRNNLAKTKVTSIIDQI